VSNGNIWLTGIAVRLYLCSPHTQLTIRAAAPGYERIRYAFVINNAFPVLMIVDPSAKVASLVRRVLDFIWLLALTVRSPAYVAIS
jgi:hypothetical protein